LEFLYNRARRNRELLQTEGGALICGIGHVRLKEHHMCNETQVNTNLGDLPLTEAKKAAIPPEYVGRVNTPFGNQYVERGSALDHAIMRSGQLSSLLLLIGGNGIDHFRDIDPKAQESILWLARQLATETQAMFEVVVADLSGGAA
jgi:hypothetical protein